MEHVIRIDWVDKEMTTLPFNTRAEAFDFLGEMQDTLLVVMHACEDEEGTPFGVQSKRQLEHTVGVQVFIRSDIILSYELAGVTS